MRCDAVAAAVAVGLIDRKHVGVVGAGAKRDAAAARGDTEDLHPSAPLDPHHTAPRLRR